MCRTCSRRYPSMKHWEWWLQDCLWMNHWRTGPVSPPHTWLNPLNCRQCISNLRTCSHNSQRVQLWDPPISGDCKPVHGVSGRNCLTVHSTPVYGSVTLTPLPFGHIEVLNPLWWSWVHSREIRTSDPQRNMMDQSTEMSPLVSMLFRPS